MKRFLFPLAIVGLVLANSFYIVSQWEQVIILRLGEAVGEKRKPGLYFKVPLLDSVIVYDNRILEINIDPKEVNTGENGNKDEGQKRDEKKRLVVDAYAKYRIIDPTVFYRSVRDERNLHSRLDPVIESSLREEIGRVSLSGLLNEQRESVMSSIKAGANEVAGNYGVEIVDVRIIRADLTEKNSNSVYERMRTQHEKEAKQTRAEGDRKALEITSNADKERRILLAEAQKTSEITRGEGDAIATKTYADAFNRDPNFYHFYRTMQAYRETFSKDDTSVILSPDSEFMRYFDRNQLR